MASGALSRLDSVVKARQFHVARISNCLAFNKHGCPVSSVLDGDLAHSPSVSRSAHIKDVNFSGGDQVAEHLDDSSAAIATGDAHLSRLASQWCRTLLRHLRVPVEARRVAELNVDLLLFNEAICRKRDSQRVCANVIMHGGSGKCMAH